MNIIYFYIYWLSSVEKMPELSSTSRPDLRDEMRGKCSGAVFNAEFSQILIHPPTHPNFNVFIVYKYLLEADS